MNEQSGIIGDSNEKWVKSQKRKEPNMALGENELKDQKVVLWLISANPVLGEKERRKEEKS